MASDAPRRMREWFAGLSTPGKALVFVIPAAAVAAAVSLIIVTGPDRPATPVSVKPAATPSAEQSATTEMPQLPPGHPAIDMTGTAGMASSGSTKTAGSTSGSSSSGSKSSGSSSSTSKSGTTNSGTTDTKTPGDGTTIPADAKRPSGPLSYEWKVKIGAELIAAEERAEAEAEAKYPTLAKNGGSSANARDHEDLRSDLVDKYKAEIKSKYELTTEEINDIEVVASQ